ncbi:MAG: GspH/FimT family pseudopilin [Pseudomonadota bacterium]
MNSIFKQASSEALSRGFSVTELMVVIAIITVFSGLVSVDILTGLSEQRLKWAAQRLISDLQSARMTSATQNRECRLIFNTKANEYQLEIQAVNSAGGGSSWVILEERRCLSDSESPFYQKNVRIDDVTRTIVCKPDGSVVSSTVTFTNRDGKTMKVRISDAGRILVE